MSDKVNISIVVTDLFCVYSATFWFFSFDWKFNNLFFLKMHLILTSLNYLKLNEYVSVYIELCKQLLRPKFANENFTHEYMNLTHEYIFSIT